MGFAPLNPSYDATTTTMLSRSRFLSRQTSLEPRLLLDGCGWPALIDRIISISIAIGPQLATQQLLIRLPEDLVRRFKRAVAPRHRSRFVEQLLEQALPPDEVSDSGPLYQAALAVERDQALTAEMAEWETTMIEDGFAGSPPPQR
jgi:hypothetical protein